MATSESAAAGSGSADTILLMKIDIGDGRTGKIEVKSGEEYIDLAKRFCTEYELPTDEVAPMLAEHIAKSVEETLATQAAKSGGTAPDAERVDQDQHDHPSTRTSESSADRTATTGDRAPRTPDISRGKAPARQDFVDSEEEIQTPTNQTSADRKAPTGDGEPRTPDTSRDRKAPARQDTVDREEEVERHAHRQVASRDRPYQGQTREDILSRAESDRGVPTSSQMYSDRVQANYRRLVNREPEPGRTKSEGVSKSHAAPLEAGSRTATKQSMADVSMSSNMSSNESFSPPERRTFSGMGLDQSPSPNSFQHNRPILRPPSNWDNVPVSLSSDLSKSSTHKGAGPVWKKLYNNGMKGKQRKQEKIEEERRRWVQPPKPRKAAGPESEEFAHLYTPRAKSAPRERHRGRHVSSDWQDESTIGSESRSSSRKKGRIEEEDGPPVWERLYQECRLKNEQRKMLARMEKEEEAMARVFDSVPKPSPSRRYEEEREVFDRLYQQGVDKANEKLRKHIEAKQDEDERIFMRRKSMHDGKIVKPFHPDIAPFARSLARDKSLEDDLDALGERKKLCLEERDVLRECMQLEPCTFQPQVLPSEYHKSRRKAVHEELYELNKTLKDKKQTRSAEVSAGRAAPSKRLTRDQRQAVMDRLWSRHEHALQERERERERERRSQTMHSPHRHRPPHLARNPLGECHGYGPSDSSPQRPAFRPGGTPNEEAGRARNMHLSSADRLLASKARAEREWGRGGASRTMEELYAARHLDTMERAKQREAQERRFDELATKAKTCTGSKRMMDKKKDEHLRALFMVLDRNNQGEIPAPAHPVQVLTLKNYFADAAVAELVVGVLADHARVSAQTVSFELFRELSLHAFTKVLPHGYSGWHVIFGHARRAPNTPRRAMAGAEGEGSSVFGLEVDVEEGEGDLGFFSEDAVEISPVCGPHPDRQHTPGRGRAPAGQFYREEMERVRLKEAWLQQKRRHSELTQLAHCTFVPQLCTPPGFPPRQAAAETRGDREELEEDAR